AFATCAPRTKPAGAPSSTDSGRQPPCAFDKPAAYHYGFAADDPCGNPTVKPMARVLTFGEIMMRLATPGFQRFMQATQLEVSYAGGEANVAVSLAAFGHEAAYVTVLPANNPLADTAVAHLRYYGVDTSHLYRTAEGR